MKHIWFLQFQQSLARTAIDNARAEALVQTIVSSIREYVISLDPQKYSKEEKEKIFIEYMDAFKETIKSNNSRNSEEKENDPSN